MRLNAKHYGPLTVRSGNGGTVAYDTSAGHAGNAAAQGTEREMSPSDLLMAALGSCLAISLEMAAQKLGVDPGPFRIVVEADVDGDLPRRFNRLAVSVKLPGIDDPAVADDLLARTERLCTVSHSLNAKITMSAVRCGVE